MNRKLVWCVVAVALALALTVAAAGVKTGIFRVEGMRNNADVQRIRTAVNALPGVQDFAADPRAQLIMVKYDSQWTSVIDLADAVDTAGYTMSPYEGTGVGSTVTQESEKKAREVLADFSIVLGQMKSAIQGEMFGLARNLAPAMKVRRDAVVAFEKSQVPSRSKMAANSPYQLSLNLSRAVDELAAAAEVKNKAHVQARLPAVNKAFRALSDARKFDDLVAVPEPQIKQEQNRSLQQQLEDMIKDWQSN